MSSDELKAAFHRFQAALLNPDELPAVLADNFVAHDLPPGTDFVSFRRGVMQFIPDEKPEFLHEFVQGNLVSSHYVARGTHQGAFMGVAPAGKAIEFEVFEIVRFGDDGKAVERWALIDLVGLMRQLDVTRLPERQ
jgi:predicted ester cyclase